MGTALRLTGPTNASRPGRNGPCPCGSGRKAKNCCLAGGPLDPSAQLVVQPSPLARLAARWLSASRRLFDDGVLLDEQMRIRAEQFLRVCRGWNPDAYREDGHPAGDLAALAHAFNGQGAAVYGVFAVGLAHLLLGQTAQAHDWMETVAGPSEQQMAAYLTATGLQGESFIGLPERALGWVERVAQA